MTKTVERENLKNIKKAVNKNNVQDKLNQLINYGTNHLGINMKNYLGIGFDIISHAYDYHITKDLLSSLKIGGFTEDAEEAKNDLIALNHEPDLQGYVFTTCNPIMPKDVKMVINCLLRDL